MIFLRLHSVFFTVAPLSYHVVQIITNQADIDALAQQEVAFRGMVAAAKIIPKIAVVVPTVKGIIHSPTAAAHREQGSCWTIFPTN